MNKPKKISKYNIFFCNGSIFSRIKEIINNPTIINK